MPHVFRFRWTLQIREQVLLSNCLEPQELPLLASRQPKQLKSRWEMIKADASVVPVVCPALVSALTVLVHNSLWAIFLKLGANPNLD